MSRLAQAKNAAVAALTQKSAREPTCAEMKATEDRLRKRREALEARNAERRKAVESRLADKHAAEVDKQAKRFERELADLASEFGCTPKPVSKPSTPRARAVKPARPDYVRGDDLRAHWGSDRIVAIYSPFVVDDDARAAKGAYLRGEGFRWSDDEHRWRRKASDAAWTAAVRAVDRLAVGIAPAAANDSPAPVKKKPAKSASTSRVYGNATEVVLTSARGALKVIPARFVLMRASDLVPSHDAQTFAARTDYPAGVQERRYEVDTNEQLKVVNVAQDMHPGLLQSTSTGAVDGTPVIAAGPAAVVLGGNGRSMGAQRHYQSGRTILRDYVIEHAGEFGLTAAQARQLEDPIIVREVDVPRSEWPRMVRDLNVTLTQTMDADTEAAAQARQLPADVIRTIAGGLAQGEIGEFLRSRASLGLVGALERSGFINRSNRGRMVESDGLLSREAALQLERQLLALLVPDTALLERLGLEIRNTLNRSAPLWLAAASSGPQWDLREPMLAALSDLRTMRHDNQCLAQWLAQTSFGRMTVAGTMGRLLLEVLDLAGGKPVVFSKVARAFFEASSGGGGLFGGNVEPMQALSDAAVGVGINPASAVSRKRCKR